MKIAVVALFALSLSGCAYKELKAPCAADEAAAGETRVLSYAPEPLHLQISTPALIRGCGPMQPLNKVAK